MLEQFATDIIEDDLLQLEYNLLGILLSDRSTNKNIIWATNDYSSLGEAYSSEAEISPNLITGIHTLLIQPRTEKALHNQQSRIREKAEVFTPSWVCNEQNNLVDDAWFGRSNVFNTADGTSWYSSTGTILFPSSRHRTWMKYVDAKRMEISCGEAPYLVSRYDATTGNAIPLSERIGILDRKFRIVNENTSDREDWIKWAIRAVQSTYGFEFQGDNLLLARENVFISFLEYYYARYQELPEKRIMEKIARIISWNLWQMDGLKLVVPYSCKVDVWEELSLFGNILHEDQCSGCQNNDNSKHNGIYCKVMDWREKQSFRYVDLLKGVQN